MTARDLGALVLLAALWGGSYPLIRIAAPVFGPLPLVAGRVLLGALVLWLGLRWSGRPLPPRRCWTRLVVLGGVNAALPFALIAAAELEITASLAAMLTATVPLWAALFGAVWLGERMTPRRALGLALGVFGVGVLVGWGGFTPTPAGLAAAGAMLVATAGYGLGGIYAKRQLSDVPGPALALGQQLGAAAWLLPPAAVALPHAHSTWPASLALVGLAVGSTAFAYLLFFHLVAAVGPTRTTTVTYLIPVFGTLWGAVFLSEPVTRGMVTGLLLILGSLVLVNGGPSPARAAATGALPPRRARHDAVGPPNFGVEAVGKPSSSYSLVPRLQRSRS